MLDIEHEHASQFEASLVIMGFHLIDLNSIDHPPWFTILYYDAGSVIDSEEYFFGVFNNTNNLNTYIF